MTYTPEDQIDDTPVAQEMEESFLSYAMSVIVSRALPDVRDGLKPVHRRLLHSMQDLNLSPASSYVKSARVVGDVIGRFHPHGDSAVYEAMVRMAQDFSMSLPLVDGHGNFGTHSDPAAAMRYCVVGDTRVRMADGSWSPVRDLGRPGDGVDQPVTLEVAGKRGEPVTASRWFDSGEQPVRTLTTVDGHTLTGSLNHPVLVLTAPLGVPVPVWKLLEEVAAGDVVVLHRGTPAAADATALPVAQVREAQLAGVFTAAGFGAGDLAGVELEDRAVAEAVTGLVDDLGVARRVAVRPSGDGVAAVAHHVLVAPADLPRVVDGVQVAPGARRVPGWVWAATPAAQAAFVSGVLATAHVATGRRGVSVVVPIESEALGADLRTLLLGLGVVTRLRRDGAGAWQLVAGSDRDLVALVTGVGFPGGLHADLADRLPRTPRGDKVPFVGSYLRSSRVPGAGRLRATFRHGVHPTPESLADLWARVTDEARTVVEPLIDGTWYFTPVASVVDAGTARVYSLRVDTDDHAFVTDGFVSHNTEARMSHAAAAMTDEIDEDTVDLKPNYDGKLTEPTVLPAAFPNLLVNGSEGIAVGMATKMPPHNLGEVVAACQHLLANPKATVDDLIQIVPAPDMPTGGLLLDVGGAHEAYRTGRGTFRMRARTEIVGRDIVVTELPYQVGPERVIESIKKLRDSGRLEEVSSVVDLSDRLNGLRLVITVKRAAKGLPVNPAAVLKKLFKYTPLEESFAVHNLALVNGAPQTLTLLELVSHYVDHRLEVTRRRCEHRRAKAEARAHLLEGYLVALANIDEVVALIRSSRDTEAARTKLMKSYKLSEVQATSILEMPLRRLTSLEVKKIKDELAELKKRIAELTRYLSNPKAMRGLVSDELGEAAARFTVPRRSAVTTVDAAAEAAEPEEDLSVPDVLCRLQLTTNGKIGRYDTGGILHGHKGARTKEDALVASLDISARRTAGVVTSAGRLLHLHPVDVPVCEGKNRGGKVEEFVADLARDESVVALVDIDPTAPMLALVTRDGVVKRIATKDFAKASGQPVIGLKGDDEVVAAVQLPAGAEDSCDLVVVTSGAQLLRFPASSVRPQGRTGSGVAGVRLGEGDRVLALGVLDPASADAAQVSVVTLSDGGGLKHTPAVEYPAKGRGGAGVRCQRMLRGETTLVAAKVAPDLGMVAPVASSGALGKVTSAPVRRDGVGEKGDLVALAWHRP